MGFCRARIEGRRIFRRDHGAVIQVLQVTVSQVIAVHVVHQAEQIGNDGSAGDGADERRADRLPGELCQSAAISARCRQRFACRQVNADGHGRGVVTPDIPRLARAGEDMRAKAEEFAGAAAGTGFDNPAEATSSRRGGGKRVIDAAERVVGVNGADAEIRPRVTLDNRGPETAVPGPLRLRSWIRTSVALIAFRTRRQGFCRSFRYGRNW